MAQAVVTFAWLLEFCPHLLHERGTRPGVRQVGLACEFADPVHLPGLSAVGREDCSIRADFGERLSQT
jgi:hypothetical protein